MRRPRKGLGILAFPFILGWRQCPRIRIRWVKKPFYCPLRCFMRSKLDLPRRNFAFANGLFMILFREIFSIFGGCAGEFRACGRGQGAFQKRSSAAQPFLICCRQYQLIFLKNGILQLLQSAIRQLLHS